MVSFVFEAPTGARDARTPRPRLVAFFLAGAGLLTAALQASPATAAQSDAPITLTEAQAVQRALNRPVVRELTQGAVGVAEGDLIEVQTLPNPLFGFEREQVSGAPSGVIERTASLSQRFDFSGRRTQRIDAARARVDAARADGESRRRQVVFDVRRRFHEALALQSTRDALTQWAERLAAAERLASTLQKGGEVAGYDRRRIAREQMNVDARLRSIEAELARHRERLAATIGAPIALPQSLEGRLLPDDPPPLEALLAAARERPDLRGASLRAEAFRREEAAAALGWIPDVTIGAGVRHIDAGTRTDAGLVLSVAVPLPLFDRSEGPRRRAAAQADLTLAQLVLEREQLEGDVRGLWMQSRQLSEAARRFGTEALDASSRLVQIAETAYRGGETTILDLLDAHRGRAEAETRAIELALAARVSRLELDFLSQEPTQ